MVYQDIQRLRNKGYRVIEKSPWHFHVFGNLGVVNIWPSKRKYMIAGGSGASKYRDIMQMVREVVGEPKVRFNPRAVIERLWAEYEIRLTPERKEAIRLHEQDMDKLQELLKKSK